jgi:hypothetical protein
MFSFLKNKPKEERTVCVLMVNSYSVTAAVVRTYHREGAVTKPVVLFSCEEKIQHHHAGGGAFDHLVIKEIKKVLEKCRQVHGNYDKISCSIGEPWAMTKAREIIIEKPKAFKVTQKILDEAIARDVRLFEQEAVRDYAKNEEWGMMHSSHPIVTINGYRVQNPVGMMAASVRMHVNISLAPVAWIEMIMGAYADVFHRADISFMGMDTAVLPLTKLYLKSCVLVLGGVSSTISVFHHEILQYIDTVPTGVVQMENILSERFGVHRAHVSSIMKFASDEKILEHERDIYYQRIEAAYKDLGLALKNIFLMLKRHVGNICGTSFCSGRSVLATNLTVIYRSRYAVSYHFSKR